LSLAESGIVGKSKNRRTPDGFYFCFVMPPNRIKFNETAMLQGNKQKMPEIYGDTVATGRGDFLVSYWLATQKEMHPLLFGHFLKCLCHSVNITKKVSNPL
jgi:hypothetical protein